MKRLILMTMVMMSVVCSAQTKKIKTALPKFLTIEATQWVDMDNDSLLDLSVTGTRNLTTWIFLYKSNGKDAIELKDSIDVGYKIQAQTFSDFNHDNKIDLIVSGNSKTEQYNNTGGFEFQRQTQTLKTKSFNRIQLADLNYDGQEDIIGLDKDSLVVYTDINGRFVHTLDTALRVSSFYVFDFDNNGYKDIVFSAADKNEKPLTMLWFLGNNFQILKRIAIANIQGEITAGDWNNDGYFDLVIAGKSDTGQSVTQLFRNDITSFSLQQNLGQFDNAHLLLADFTSDGIADLALKGEGPLGQAQNIIQEFSGNIISLKPTVAQAFGDYDRDGDLDWAQVDTDSIRIFSNEATFKNKGPSKAFNAIALQFWGKTFFYWEKPSDDHTQTPAITYDLKIFSPDSTYVASQFDADSRHRLLVSHGNMGTVNYAILDIQGNNNFEIQTIDNAFVPNPKAVCSGICIACASAREQLVVVCGNNQITLTASAPQAMWFSVSRGYLGEGDTYVYKEAFSDQIFSFNPMSGDACATARLFDVKFYPVNPTKQDSVIYACKDSEVHLEIAPEWQSATWSNNLNSNTTSGLSFDYPLTANIIFMATSVLPGGCKLEETFSVNISSPNLKLNGTQFQIIRGNSVQLEATGADTYSWTPSDYLDKNNIANPISTPDVTVEYTVAAIDSIGCMATANVVIEVREEAFIPTLFTPNGDGKNDNLKIYGLTHASNFHFTIYNREGSVVYETKDIGDITNNGWSGVVNGSNQPTGTYYWKISGRMPKGELLLNGKKNGAFLLVR